MSSSESTSYWKTLPETADGLSVSDATPNPAPTSPTAETPRRPPPRPEPQQHDKPQHEDVVRRQTLSGFITSLTFHLVLLLIFACIILPQKNIDQILTVFAAASEETDLDEILEIGLPIVDEKFEVQQTDMIIAKVVEPEPQIEIDVNDLDVSLPLEDSAFLGPQLKVNLNSEFGGRSKAARSALVRSQGGNAASEAAVEMGLKWLKNHQHSDGSWTFAHHVNRRCTKECTQPGYLKNNRTGATAMALLAFLGAGNTHKQGKYQREVRDGLEYLIRNLELSQRGGEIRVENRHKMYVQGLATIALCEAHAMTRSISASSDSADSDGSRKTRSKKTARKKTARKSRKNRMSILRLTGRKQQEQLAKAAQSAIDYISWAQDPNGGGWRYEPRERGDTSVVGWQLMALQSARAGDLATDPVVFQKVGYFLDSVQSQRGSQYGYVSPDVGRHTTTAIGLLCRMYLGWNRDNPALRQGIQVLSETGPDFDDMYYNYYATQVLHHWGGEVWKDWNEVMRDHLVETQSKNGHAMGSWDVADHHGRPGGRLYMTCLCIMTLEVYYRHLPLYQRDMLAEPQ